MLIIYNNPNAFQPLYLPGNGPRSMLHHLALMFLSHSIWPLDKLTTLRIFIHDLLHLLYAGYTRTMHYLDGTRIEITIDGWLSYNSKFYPCTSRWILDLVLDWCTWKDVGAFFFYFSELAMLHHHLLLSIGLAFVCYFGSSESGFLSPALPPVLPCRDLVWIPMDSWKVSTAQYILAMMCWTGGEYCFCGGMGTIVDIDSKMQLNSQTFFLL